MFKKSNQKGFTLIELLVSISILTILGAAVFVALDPAKRIQGANNARRSSDVNAILTAIHEYIVDNDGAYPAGLSASGTSISQLGTAATGCDGAVGSCTIAAGQGACVDLSTPLATYLKSIPKDPKLAAAATEYEYAVTVDTNGIVTVTACSAEDGETISVSR